MRLDAKLSTTIAAEIAGVKTRKTYENWERGAGIPNINQFVALCEGYKLSPNVILALAIKRRRENIDGPLDLEPARKFYKKKPAHH
jgi:transcriptional regulator with XRE-family HTH domain